MCLEIEHTVEKFSPTQLDGNLISLFLLHSFSKPVQTATPNILFSSPAPPRNAVRLTSPRSI